MAVARGIITKALLWDEVTYGVTPASPSAEKLHFKTFTVSATMQRLVDETISSFRGMPASIVGQRDISGQITVNLAPQSAMRLLQHAIGHPATVGAAAPYTHTFSLANPLRPGFGLELDYGPAVPAPGRYLRFSGCRIARASFRFAANGFCEATFDVRGANFDLTAASSIDATPDDFGHTAFSMHSATITEGGGAIATCESSQIDWDNDLDDSLFVIGAGGVRGDLPEGFARLSGNGSFLFNSPALLNKGINSTDTSLVLTLQHGTGVGTAGNEKVTFTLPNLYWDVTTPGVNGPKGLKQALNFNGHRPGAGTTELAASIELLNARAALT